MSIDSKLFRTVLGRFATGVTIVTTKTADGIHGMTANAFSSVSLDPPLVLVCVDKRANTHRWIQDVQAFGINVLGRDQEDLSVRFSRRIPAQNADGPHLDPNEPRAYNLFDDIPYHELVTGSPIFDRCVAYLDCRLEAVHDTGDHSIFVGRVEAAGVGGEEKPLLFYGSAYRSIAE